MYQRNCFGVLAAASLFLAVPAAGETLADALIQAYQTSPELRLNQAALRNVDEGVAQARSALRPSVSTSFSASTTDTFQNGGSVFSSTGTNSGIAAQLSASLLLYDGGQTDAAIAAARERVLAQRQSLVDTEQSILLAAVTAYMDYRRDLQFVELAESNVRVLTQQVRAAKDRFEVGEVTKTDVSQAQSRLASARSNLEFQKGALANTRQAYKAAVGSFPKSLKPPPPAPKLPKTAKKAENIAVSRHPRILQAHFNASSAQYDLNRANRNRSPRISATADYTISNSEGSRQSSSAELGISGSVPLYSGGNLKSLRRQAQAVLEQRNSEVQYAGLITRQSVNRAYANWRVFGASITARREQVSAAKVAFEGVREEAKLGARTTLDALDAEQELLNAKSDLVSALRDQYVAAYTVLSEMGLLTVRHLNLGIESYNPDDYYSQANSLSKFDKKRGAVLDWLQNR